MVVYALQHKLEQLKPVAKKGCHSWSVQKKRAENYFELPFSLRRIFPHVFPCFRPHIFPPSPPLPSKCHPHESWKDIATRSPGLQGCLHKSCEVAGGERGRTMRQEYQVSCDKNFIGHIMAVAIHPFQTVGARASPIWGTLQKRSESRQFRPFLAKNQDMKGDSMRFGPVLTTFFAPFSFKNNRRFRSALHPNWTTQLLWQTLGGFCVGIHVRPKKGGTKKTFFGQNWVKNLQLR